MRRSVLSFSMSIVRRYRSLDRDMAARREERVLSKSALMDGQVGSQTPVTRETISHRQDM